VRSIISHIASILILSVFAYVLADSQSVRRTFGFDPARYPPDTTINCHHKDVIATWFTAPVTGSIDTIFWLSGDTIGASDSTLYMRSHASRVSASYGPGVNYPAPPIAWGYFANTNDPDRGIAAFPEDATPPDTTTWTSTVPSWPFPSKWPFRNSIWAWGASVTDHPAIVNAVAMMDMGQDLYVTAGQTFFVSFRIKGPAPHVNDLPTQFRASHSHVPFPAHDWIFFEHDSVLNPSAPKGWWVVGGVNFNIWYSMAVPPVSFNVPLHGRWNLVSIPVEVGTDSVSAILPTATSNAFRYAGGKYEYGSTMKHGTGYWLTFPPSGNINFSGIPIADDTIDVNAGWNLIGTLGAIIPPSWITSIPSGIVTSNFWGYDGAYIVAAMLTPGNGYWVKANQSGKLILSASGSVASPLAKIIIQADNELPPPPPDGEIPNPKPQTPNHFTLEQNYPNPFNPSTDIRYQIADRSHVILQIFNLLGEEVARLVDESQDAGYKSVRWSAGEIASGVYFYKLTTVNASDRSRTFVQVRRMVVLR